MSRKTPRPYIYEPAFSSPDMIIAPSTIAGAGVGIIAIRLIPRHTIILIEKENRQARQNFNKNRLDVRLSSSDDSIIHHMDLDHRLTYYTYDWHGNDKPVLFPITGLFNHKNIQTNCCFIISPNIYKPMNDFIRAHELKPIPMTAVIMTTRDVYAGEELFLNYHPRTIPGDPVQLSQARGIPYERLRDQALQQEQHRKIRRIAMSAVRTSTPFKETLIRNFQETNKTLKQALSLFYGDDDLNQEIMNLYVKALLFWRVIVYSMIRAYPDFLPDNDEAFDEVLSHHYGVSLKSLRVFFKKMKKILEKIRIQGPIYPYDPDRLLQQSIWETSLYNILNTIVPPNTEFDIEKKGHQQAMLRLSILPPHTHKKQSQERSMGQILRRQSQRSADGFVPIYNIKRTTHFNRVI